MYRISHKNYQQNQNDEQVTLVEIALTFYMLHGNMQAICFTKHGKCMEPAWKHFVGLQCSRHYLN